MQEACHLVTIPASPNRLLTRAARNRFRATNRLQTATRHPLQGCPPGSGQSRPDRTFEIPRLGLATIIIEGSDQATLRRAAGHVPGTALPGQAGNTAITGHRDSFFRPLRNVERDDLIRVTTPRAEYLYRVVSLSIVGPDDLRVLDSDGGETLTLITCYPFHFVGGAPRRFIVRAARVPHPIPAGLAR